MVETMVAWGVRHVFGMVGHSNLGLADAIRRRVEAGELEYIGIRHEGAAAFAASAYGKLTGRPAACLTIAGPGRDQPHDRAVGRQGRPRAGARPHRPGRHPGPGPGRLPGGRPAAAFAPVAAWSQTVLPESHHAELMALACKHALLRRDVAHLVFPDDVQTLPAPDAPVAWPEGRVAPLGDRRRPRSRSRPRSTCSPARRARSSSSATARATTWSRSSRSPSASARRS